MAERFETGFGRGPIVVALALATLAFGIRVGVLAFGPDPGLMGDELYYADTALHIAQGKGHYSASRRSRAGWPPGQSFVLSTVVAPDSNETFGRMEDRTLWRFRILVSLLGALLVVAVAGLGRALFDARTAVFAGLLAAVYPTFVAYSHYLFAETLFLLLAVGALAAAVAAARTGSWLAVVAAGLGFGLAGLTRELGGLLAGCVALWWMFFVSWDGGPTGPRRPDRAGLARACLLIACTGAVVVPWSLRNLDVLGRWVPVSTVGWMGVREGNTLGGPDWLRPHPPSLRDFQIRYFSEPDELARADLARREALELIADEQPWWLVKKAVRNAGLLFAPDSFLLLRLSRNVYGPVELGWIRLLLVLTAGSYLAILSCAIAGIGVSRGSERWLALLVTTTIIALHVFAQANSRYRLPLMPFAMIFAVRGLVDWRRLASIPTWQRAILVAAGVALVIWPAIYFAPDAWGLWQTGHYRTR